MTKIEYTKEQIEELLSNSNVKACTKKYITFTDEFKLKSVELNKQWLLSKRIFKDFWFPEYILNSITPSDSIRRWKFKLKNKWLSWLIQTKKWRKKVEKIDISKMTQEEKIKYLETENAYLKELHKQIYWKYP